MPLEPVNLLVDAGSRFATTRWTTVQTAIDPSSPEALSCLERLCQHYWPPLYGFARRQGNDVHTAQDLTQAFFAHFIGKGYLRAADRSRGRFRTFLLTSFSHFLTHEWEKARAEKRGGRFELTSWEEQLATLESQLACSQPAPPERDYDRQWALTALERALARLRSEFSAAGQDAHFAVLGPFLHAEAQTGEYQAIATQLGVSDRWVKVAVHRLRRRYGRLVREEIRDTVLTDSEVEDEMAYLVELLSG